jgi:hypothetical protein
MIDPTHVPPVADEKLLARFIVHHSDIIGYPERKDEQLSLAEKLAAAIEGKWKSPPPIDGKAGIEA